MVNLTSLFALATLGTSMASAVHIDFRRFADEKCEPRHHIRKTSDLHATHCKSFDPNELGFHSFSFDITKHHKDLEKKDCRIVVYAGKNCHGEAVTFGDMKGMDGACAKIDIEGRSVRLECGKKKDPEIRILTPKPEQPKTHTHTHTPKPTVTVTHIHEYEPGHTMTVVPKKEDGHVVCKYEDPDEWA